MFSRILRASIGQVKKQFLKITPAAQRRIETLLRRKKDPEIRGVKISLTKKGCNGLTYAMNYVKEWNKLDEVIERDNFTLVVDSKALMAVVGTEMDYVENELGSEFVFNNPNEKGRCGCGQSFHL